jgi:hypothetical protein
MIFFFIEIKDLRSAEQIIYCSCTFAPSLWVILTLTNLISHRISDHRSCFINLLLSKLIRICPNPGEV